MNLLFTKKLISFGAYVLKNCVVSELITKPTRPDPKRNVLTEDVTPEMLEAWRAFIAQHEPELLDDVLPGEHQMGDLVEIPLFGHTIPAQIDGVHFKGSLLEISYDLLIDLHDGRPVRIENILGRHINSLRSQTKTA